MWQELKWTHENDNQMQKKFAVVWLKKGHIWVRELNSTF